MRVSVPIVSVLLFLNLVACWNYHDPKLASAWDDVKVRPDSVLTALDRYSPSDFKSRKSQAELALLKSIALDKSYIDITSDSLIRIALDYYDKKGGKRDRMLAWYYMGRVYANRKEYNDAIVSIIRAEEYSHQVDDPYYQALICMAKENIYSNTHNYSEALQAAQDGVRIFEEAGETRQSLLAKRRWALDYIAIRDYVPADSLLKVIIHDRSADSTLVGRCLLNYAWSLVHQERYQEALSYYEKGTTEYHIPLSLPQLEEYGVALYHVGRGVEADALKNRLANVPSAHKSYLLLSYYSCKLAGRFQEALGYQRAMMQLEDSVAVSTLEQSLIKSQRDYQQKNSEVFRIKADNRRLALIGIVLLSIVVVLSLLLGLIYVRRQQRLKVEQLMEVQEEIQNLLREANERSSDLEDQLTVARKQFIAAYRKRFSKVAHLSETYFRSSGSKEGRELVYREVRDLASFLTTDNRTYRRLEDEVNTSLSGAMEWFRKEYDEMKESDYRFVCYLMAGFPASTIGLLTGLSQNNVYVRKNRLIGSINNSSVEHKDLFLLVLK